MSVVCLRVALRRDSFRRFGLPLALAAALSFLVSGCSLLSRAGGATTTSAVVNDATPATPLSIDATQTHQTLTGFGAATAYYQNWITAHPSKSALYDALFKGLKLDILRLPNTYRPEKGSGFASDDVQIVQAAQQSLGHPVTILMSSWSPPARLKSNHEEKGGGTLARDASGKFEYAQFGQYWYDALVAYHKIGIDPAYVSIQNEPDWKADWESCLFKPTEQSEDGMEYAGYDRAFDAVYAKLHQLPTAPNLIGPETTGIDNGKPQTYLDPARDASRLQHVYGIAYHLYNGGTQTDPDSFLPRFQSIRDSYPSKPRMMTEFGRSDGLQTAWLINNSLTDADATSYIYWAAVWPGDDCLISIDNPYQRTGWKYPGGYQLNDRYFALKHFSFYTAPGYQRVDASAPSDPALKTSAFLSPRRDWLVVIALNTSDTVEKAVTLNLKGFTRGDSAEVHRTVFPSAAGSAMSEQFKDIGSLGSDNKVTLPPRSIITIALSAQGGPASQ